MSVCVRVGDSDGEKGDETGTHLYRSPSRWRSLRVWSLEIGERVNRGSCALRIYTESASGGTSLLRRFHPAAPNKFGRAAPESAGPPFVRAHRDFPVLRVRPCRYDAPAILLHFTIRLFRSPVVQGLTARTWTAESSDGSILRHRSTPSARRRRILVADDITDRRDGTQRTVRNTLDLRFPFIICDI